jgi:hypothetical protein
LSVVANAADHDLAATIWSDIPILRAQGFGEIIN